MKKMKIAIGVILLALVGCTPLEKKISDEERILLPSVPKQAYDVSISTMPEGEFIPQTDIIHTGQNVALAENAVTEITLNGIDQVNIAKKQVRNRLAYNGNSTVPFTGTFAAVVGVHKHYTEDYRDGKLNGYKIWYSEAGRVGLKEPYANGVKNGVQETYYRNTGNIRSRITYSGGRISGPATWDNGKIREKGRLAGGLQNGEWRSYTPKGELEKITNYRNGSPLSQEWLK